MATISVRVPDELKARMDEHAEINWSAVVREHLAETLDEQRERRLARAVLTSERLSGAIDPEDVRDQDTTGIVREWRDRRYGTRNDESRLHNGDAGE